MLATKLGLGSASLASLCCVVPVGLAVLGLGGLGVGAFIDANHWYFIAVAGVLLALSWYAYWRERRRCRTERCEIVGGKTARVALPLATLAVVGFFGLNLYTYAGADGQEIGLVPSAHAQITIPVEGMTCYSCTAHVEQNLKGLDGVQDVAASVPQKAVTVTYDPELISVEQLIDRVNETGYRAHKPIG